MMDEMESALTKVPAEAERLRALNAELVAALQSLLPSIEGRLTAKRGDVDAWNIVAEARAALAKAQSGGAA